jgi:hypothetical protein
VGNLSEVLDVIQVRHIDLVVLLSTPDLTFFDLIVLFGLKLSLHCGILLLYSF